MSGKIKIVYLLGIGGIGMSALARYFNHLGCFVSGYDKTPTELTSQLMKEGIQVHFDDDVKLIPEQLLNSPADEVLVIYTPAIPKDHTEYNYLLSKSIHLHKRAEVLGKITASNHNIAVAGTHGKTTTSTMIAHILTSSGVKTNAFLGGISGNYNTNLLLNNQASTTVLEADEYDRSFLQLYPDLAVITSMDADHLDIYGDSSQIEKSYNDFAKQIKPGGMLIHKYGLPLEGNVETLTYGVTKSADFNAADIRIANGKYTYNLVTPDQTISNLTIGLPGRHNVENSVAASAVALQMGVSEDQLREALASFKGAKRRFDYIVNSEKVIYIDDYAHHPEELRACIQSVKELYPGKRVLGIFQPHLFTRTRDFADGFAKSLDLLDDALLLEIYPAREKPIEGINSLLLINKMKNTNKQLVSKSELMNEIVNRKPDVVLTLGAGDIDQLIEPIKLILTT